MIPRLFLILMFSATLILANPLATYFRQGAEISSYKTMQPRYGENREGMTVLVFVPEDISRTTRIKVEDYGKVPPADRVPVIKFNRVLHFNTGVYDYSVSTTVFCAKNPEFGKSPYYPMKISLNVSEWCGNYCEILLPDREGAKRSLHSYFQAEGDRMDFLTAPPQSYYEDNFPVLIREFNGEIMSLDKKIDCPIMPSLWHSRTTHIPLAYQPGFFRKKAGETLAVEGKEVKTIEWEWQVGDRSVRYWTEADFPHRIIQWKDSEGGSGVLYKTRYLRYWEKHSNRDLPLRKELGLN
jgi:hypothetical protein